MRGHMKNASGSVGRQRGGRGEHSHSLYWGFCEKEWVRHGRYVSKFRMDSLNNFGLWLQGWSLVAWLLDPVVT